MEAIDRAVDLCSGTLAYTQEGGQPLHRSRVDLHALVDAAAEDLAAVINSDGHWDNRVPPGLVIMADPEQLQRVLVNLGRNAFQAGASTVTISAEQADSGLALIVEDDGPGLPPKVQQHLFRPFTTAQKGGTGLGLAIAREIITAHRGDIRLDRTDAQGTVFRIELPTGLAVARKAA